MPDTINGIPVHPLVVHAIVVLLPLATLGTLAIAVRPAWRLKYGHLVVASAAIATALMPIATESGESLEELVGEPGEHAELGESLIWFSLALLVLSLALVLLERRRSRAEDPGSGKTLINVVAALACVAALASAVQVYRVGDSGARAAWEDAGSSSATGD